MKNFACLKLFLCSLFLLLSIKIYAQDPNFHIYLCFGQSNMAGAGAIETQDKTVNSRFQVMASADCSQFNRKFGKWSPAIPPLWGCPTGGLCPVDYFGRTMVDSLPSNIKIGVIVIGIPGCDIALFGKTGYQGFDTYKYVPTRYNGSAYAWLMDLAKLAKQDGVIKGILMHQGETNSGQATWPNKVKTVYDNIIADLGLVASKTPLLVGELLYQNQGGACGGHNTIIATVPNVIPNSYVISANGLPGNENDKFHFNSLGNRNFGIRYAQKMLLLLEKSMVKQTNFVTSPEHFDLQNYSDGTIKISTDDQYNYSVTNIRGALVEKGNAKGELIVGTKFTPGIYFLSIQNRSGIFTGKLLKK